MTTTIARRSNRPLTEFACSFLQKFWAKQQQGTGQLAQGNTSIDFESSDSHQRVTVSLFGSPILALVAVDMRPVVLRVEFGNRYDIHGNPTNTTRERLNGLLDRLGELGIIPDGVRIFRDREKEMTYLGRYDDAVAVGKHFAHSVSIQPNPDRLMMTAFDPSRPDVGQ